MFRNFCESRQQFPASAVEGMFEYESQDYGSNLTVVKNVFILNFLACFVFLDQANTNEIKHENHLR